MKKAPSGAFLVSGALVGGLFLGPCVGGLVLIPRVGSEPAGHLKRAKAWPRPPQQGGTVALPGAAVHAGEQARAAGARACRSARACGERASSSPSVAGTLRSARGCRLRPERRSPVPGCVNRSPQNSVSVRRVEQVAALPAVRQVRRSTATPACGVRDQASWPSGRPIGSDVDEVADRHHRGHMRCTPAAPPAPLPGNPAGCRIRRLRRARTRCSATCASGSTFSICARTRPKQLLRAGVKQQRPLVDDEVLVERESAGEPRRRDRDLNAIGVGRDLVDGGVGDHVHFVLLGRGLGRAAGCGPMTASSK